MVSAKLAQVSTSSAVSWYCPAIRRVSLQKFEERHRLAPAVNFAGAEFACVGAVDGSPLRIFDLGDIDAPFARMLLRSHDRAFARKSDAAFFRRLHQGGDGAPGFASQRSIDSVHAEHHRREKHVTVSVAFFV